MADIILNPMAYLVPSCPYYVGSGTSIAWTFRYSWQKSNPNCLKQKENVLIQMTVRIFKPWRKWQITKVWWSIRTVIHCFSLKKKQPYSFNLWYNANYEPLFQTLFLFPGKLYDFFNTILISVNLRKLASKTYVSPRLFIKILYLQL